MDCQIPASIKIGGIPLLPPLITNSIATEIHYYKQLAIAVEERLKVLENAKEALEKNQDESVIEDNKSKDYSTESDLMILEQQEQSNVQMNTFVAVDHPTKEEIPNLIDADIPVIDSSKTDLLINKDLNSEPKQNELDQLDKSDEDKSCLNDTLLAESVSSDAITASTDLNQYLNVSASSKTDTTETTETTPESWKPQVPKTLDIVPISLDQLKPIDKLSSDSDDTPKLVRQGSYILDAPSPMLLAHMQNESSNSEFIPTSSAESIKHKEWSITQNKSERKNECNFKEPSSSCLSSMNKVKKKSGMPNQRVSKSVSNSKSGSPLDVYKPAKSVDCIQAMFAKECYSPKTVNSRSTNHAQKFSSLNGTNGVKKNSKNISTLNLADKLSSSLGSLNNNSPKPVRRVEKKNSQESHLKTNINSTSNSVKSDHSSVPLKKQKPVVTSEKIVNVFKEIQDTHKKQMLELITRQQKEQMLMQENFKKQQILLLAQIRKAFPEISISALSEAICGRKSGHNTPLSSTTTSEKSYALHKNNEKSKINGISQFEENKQSSSKLIVDSNYFSRESSITYQSSIQQITPVISPYSQSNSQATQTSENIPSSCVNSFGLSNVRDIDEIPVGNPIRRHSGVSRQLFPHDGKTNHAPVIDNSIYTEEHIKAATTINAFAKGFLVRRLMNTEKVIALKNTYKEALHCMLRLHVDAPLNLPELNFHKRLQLQCDAASMSIVELFSQSPINRMEIIAHDREIKKARSDRPSSARSTYSFATQRTLARKKLKEMGAHQNHQSSIMTKSCPARTRCQTWGSNSKERRITTSMISQGMKRSTSAGAVRKPWR